MAVSEADLASLRGFVASCVSHNMLSAAAFFADKALSLSAAREAAGAATDALALAQVHHFRGQHLRSVQTLKANGLLEGATPRPRLPAVQLAAQALLAAERYEQVLELLEDFLPSEKDLVALRHLAAEVTKAESDGGASGIAAGTRQQSPPASPGALPEPPRIRSSPRVRPPSAPRRAQEAPPTSPGLHVVASLCTTAGLALEALENRNRAANYLLAALEVDVRAVDAFEALLNGRLLPVARLATLLDDLVARLPASLGWLGAYYRARAPAHLPISSEDPFSRLMAPPLKPLLKRPEETSPLDGKSPASGASGSSGSGAGGWGLGSNQDVLTAKAESHYYKGEAAEARALALRVHDLDPHHERAALVLFASLLELNAKHDLYYIAHKLIESHPGAAVSWVGVGCYYLATKRPDLAQRYFHKATKLQPRLAEAWIGFGNAFSAQDESDQAMAAYRSAARLLPGSHVPPLYIGMEYLRANNLSLAKSFLAGAVTLHADDALGYNEMGVVHYRKGSYAKAEALFRKALSLARLTAPKEAVLPMRTPMGEATGGASRTPDSVSTPTSRMGDMRLAPDGHDSVEKQDPSLAHRTHLRLWAPTLVNLGHTLRKQQRFGEALANYSVALAMDPHAADVRAAAAFTHHLAGDVGKAISMYHQSLAIRPDDAFASEMLEKALQVAVTDPSVHLPRKGPEADAGMKTNASMGNPRGRLSFASAQLPDASYGFTPAGPRDTSMTGADTPFSPLNFSGIGGAGARRPRFSVGSNIHMNTTITGANESGFDMAAATPSPGQAAAPPARAMRTPQEMQTPHSMMSSLDETMDDSMIFSDEAAETPERRRG